LRGNGTLVDRLPAAFAALLAALLAALAALLVALAALLAFASL